MANSKKYALSFLVVVVGMAFTTLFGPEEKTLGTNVRVVYLHGAWVLAAEFSFLAAALAGAGGLLVRIVRRFAQWETTLHLWSAACGRGGILKIV